jgi:bifunctional non-homologous end joining protein LigD
MLATLVDKVPSNGWIYEIKWDGYRAIALCQGKKVEIISRNNKSFNVKYYPIHTELQKLGLQAVLDGELVVVGEEGITRFEALQNWRSEADGELLYYVFDLLWHKGHDLTEVPLKQRKELLKQIDLGTSLIRKSESVAGSPTHLLNTAKKMGLEGIMAKKANSYYFPGERRSEWLKIKALKRHEAVIGGYTLNADSPKTI